MSGRALLQLLLYPPFYGGKRMIKKTFQSAATAATGLLQFAPENPFNSQRLVKSAATAATAATHL